MQRLQMLEDIEGLYQHVAVQHLICDNKENAPLSWVLVNINTVYSVNKLNILLRTALVLGDTRLRVKKSYYC